MSKYVVNLLIPVINKKQSKNTIRNNLSKLCFINSVLYIFCNFKGEKTSWKCYQFQQMKKILQKKYPDTLKIKTDLH